MPKDVEKLIDEQNTIELNKKIDKVTRFLNSLLLLSIKFDLFIDLDDEDIVLRDGNNNIICGNLDGDDGFYSCFYRHSNINYFLCSDDVDDSKDKLSNYYVDKNKIEEFYKKYLSETMKDFSPYVKDESTPEKERKAGQLYILTNLQEKLLK